MRKFDTLDTEATRLTFESARLADEIYAGDTSLNPRLDAVRTKLAALNAEMESRTYYRGRKLCHR